LTFPTAFAVGGSALESVRIFSYVSSHYKCLLYMMFTSIFLKFLTKNITLNVNILV
jgi:hypothetical protein